MSQILLVDDARSYAEQIARKLSESKYGHAVDYAASPAEARSLLSQRRYDCLVVDVLYRPLVQEFERLHRTGLVSATSGPFVESGLDVLRAASANKQKAPAVIWTDGTENRQLHMVYAYERFNTRVFSYKDAAGEAPQVLSDAIRSAIAGQELIAREIKEDGVRPDRFSIKTLLFENPKWAQVWRALALGATSHGGIQARLPRGTFYKRGMIGDMAIGANNMNENSELDRDPLAFCVAYANRHRLFFLDATVKEDFP